LRTAARLITGAAAVLCVFSVQAQSRMSSSNYKIFADNFTATSSSATMTSSNYSMVGGTLGQTGYATTSGGLYSLKGGLMGSSSLAEGSLDNAYAYPDPFKSTMGVQSVTFTNLTQIATITIYTISGEKVRTLSKNDTGNSFSWDLHNESGMRVASGLYIYAITSGSLRKTGKLIIIW